MPGKLRVGLVGATGYAGFELARLLQRHPRLHAPVLFRRESDNGASDLADVFPHVAGNGSLPLEPFSWDRLRRAGLELLFLATPHEVSRQWVPQALASGVRVIDLSGAWRLKLPQHREPYGFHDDDPAAAEQVSSSAVYGLPELHRERIAAARLVANPGCYPTSIILPLAPLLAADLLEPAQGIVCDSKSGVSGAGKQPTAKTHFVEVADNLCAYGVFAHRHTGEILEQLRLPAERLVFTPHLLPVPRGILSTIYVRLRHNTTPAELDSCLRSFYSGRPWVRVFPPGRLPQLQHSAHTNYCDIGFALAPDGRRLVLVSCLDNLIKGAAGQAAQNMNVMFGFDEREGLV